MNKQEFQQKIKDMKPPKFFNAITLREAYEAGFEEAKSNALCDSCFLNEPEKPVIPKYVADWIEWCKKNNVTLLGAMSPIDELGTAICDDKKVESLDASKWATRNQETFAKAWLYGYEIEKEKLYTAFQIATEEYLYTNVVGKLSSAHVSYAFVEEIKKYHFTQQKLEELKYWKNPAFEIKEVKK